MSTIPDQIDVVVIGTGLTNSIVAAACSRIGKSVLHLDKNNYYGDNWASFTFQQLVDWIRVMDPLNPSLESIPEELINKSRMFCIDLAPRFLYSNGSMVDLLVKSNVARYHEFKNNIRILCMISEHNEDGTLANEQIHVMPCRRNEVFTSPLLSNLADKRRLMKFIESCMHYKESKSQNKGTGDCLDQTSSDSAEQEELHSDKPISKYLEEKGLKSNLNEFIVNSIAMVEPTETVNEACKKIKRFMIATERYGRSPFLFPLYGCGEFPQSFCRLSAVFGGIYCLNTNIDEVVINSSSSKQECDSKTTSRSTEQPSANNFDVKFSNGEHQVKCDLLVIDQKNAIELKLTKPPPINEHLSRAIVITTKRIVQSENNEDFVSLLRIPPSEGKSANVVYLLEFNSSALVCPKDLNIVYLWTKASTAKPEEDLREIVDRIFKSANCSDCIAWKFFFQQPIADPTEVFRNTRLNKDNSLHASSPLCDDFDYDANIKEAEQIFHRMYPDQEFLPRAPDPDEIISITCESLDASEAPLQEQQQ